MTRGMALFTKGKIIPFTISHVIMFVPMIMASRIMMREESICTIFKWFMAKESGRIFQGTNWNFLSLWTRLTSIVGYLSQFPKTGHNELRHVLIGGLDVDPNGRPFILYGHGRGAWAGIDRTWRLAIGDPASGKWSTYDAPHGGPITVQNNGHIIIWGNIISVSKDTARTWINKDKLRNYGLGGVSLVNNGQSKARFVAHDTWGEVKDGEKWRNRKVFLWGEQGFITQADEP